MFNLPKVNRLLKLCSVSLLLAVTSCATTSPTIPTTSPPDKVCLADLPIQYTLHDPRNPATDDTPATVDRVRAHNAFIRAYCKR